jgi:hypothetical protein
LLTRRYAIPDAVFGLRARLGAVPILISEPVWEIASIDGYVTNFGSAFNSGHNSG